MRIKKFAIAVAAIVIGSTVATAPPAAAETRAVIKMFQHSNFTGTTGYLSVNWVGNCDYAGYKKDLPTGWWKSNLSSIQAVNAPGCNHATIYEQTWAGTWGAICWSGYLPASSIGNCNDDAARINIRRL